MSPPIDSDRAEHYRGPGRGDGHRRRSIAWIEQRDDALTRPCPYVMTIPAPRGYGGGARRLACGAQVGEVCREPRTGKELTRFAAHSDRLKPSLALPEESPTS